MKAPPKAMTVIFLVSLIAVNIPNSAEGNAPRRGAWSTDLTLDMNISEAALASFLGEDPYDQSGYSVCGAGDVNGDGFDDILIGANQDEEGAYNAGQTYLVFGKASGWTMDMNLSDADASFLGEHDGDSSGHSVSGAGDVNGDGFDDILIGANADADGGLDAGQTYLILGKSSGWTMNQNLSTADASFIGEHNYDKSGDSVSGAGDVNGDGFDDFLIGAYGNEEGGAGNTGQTYLILGMASGWAMDQDLSTVDASFIGEEASDWSAYSVSGAGDVNDDGFDDILVGATDNDAGGGQAGQVYLILGKASGWAMDTDLSASDASFWGEEDTDYAGVSVSGPGDVNGDGFDDIFVLASNNDEGGDNYGQAYLIFGKASGWTMDQEISTADASFIGQTTGSWTSRQVSGAGDVNGDGYADLLVGDSYEDEVNIDSGQTYLIYGKADGWAMDQLLNETDVSFIGEDVNDQVGHSAFGAGDVNGDGNDDIIIGAPGDEEGGGENAGQAYLISIEGFSEPLMVYDVTVKNVLGDPVTMADIGETVQIEMSGLDRNASHIDMARVNVTYSGGGPGPVMVRLIETGLNTGIYKGPYKVLAGARYFQSMRFSAYVDQTKTYDVVVDYPFRPKTVNSLTIHEDPVNTAIKDKFDFGETVYFKTMGVDANPSKVDKDFINLSSNKNASFAPMIICTETGANTGTYIGSSVVLNTMAYFENITAKSVRNTLVTAKFMVHTPVQIRAVGDPVYSKEDEDYSVSFFNFGYNSVSWDVSYNEGWLSWDTASHTLSGAPDNGDVGPWDVQVSIDDHQGHYDEMEFQVIVGNTPPAITNQPVIDATEDDYYLSDLNCDDDEQGTITWHLVTDVEWLNMNIYNGELTGTPSDIDVGTRPIVVTVDDGNDGWDEVLYNLTVHGVNDRPTITTTDVLTVTQGQNYYRNYDAIDPDMNEELRWAVITNASWLKIDNATGELKGKPEKWDVGTFLVIVVVTDLSGGTDSHEFNLTVENINDKPEWRSVPNSTQIVHGQLFTFDVNAIDPDPDTVLEYSILRTIPDSDMEMDPETGVIEWVADVSIFNSTSYFVLEVTFKVSDGEASVQYEFVLNVVPTESPICHLLRPVKGSKTPSAYSLLQWEGLDPENETLTYKVYLDGSEAFVSGLRADCFMVEEVTRAEINITSLQPGNTYYWTVIPHDGGTKGTSTNGPFSFKVNNAPTLRSVSDQKASTGSQLSIKVSGSDPDTEDKVLLRYSLYEAPEGMRIDPGTGKVTWTPSDEQTGFHDVTVRLTDGVDTTSVTFAIEVEEGEDQNLWIFLVLGALILVIIGLVVWIVLSRRKGPAEKEVDEKAEDTDEESARIAEEMERHRKEMEWEKEHLHDGSSNASTLTGPSAGAAAPVSSVPLTPEEAHARDKASKPLSYEELYGVPAPPSKTEEAMTSKELKDYISKQIEELEGGKAPGPEPPVKGDAPPASK